MVKSGKFYSVYSSNVFLSFDRDRTVSAAQRIFQVDEKRLDSVIRGMFNRTLRLVFELADRSADHTTVSRV